MISRLRIQNLILVDEADIAFGQGLNILTGETGSGKSAILSAIRLIQGERADAQMIGQNGEIAIVEAFLSSYSLPEEIAPPPPGAPLVVRREIHRSGRNRCFVEEQQVSLAMLKQIIGTSIELVDQSSSHLLSLPDRQREMLDIFANLPEEVKRLGVGYAEEMALQKRWEECAAAQERRERDLQWAEEDLSFIEEVNLKEGEEEKIAEEHSRLSKPQVLQDKVERLLQSLEESSLKKVYPLLESCAKMDSILSPPLTQFKSALLELEEVQNALRRYLDKIEPDPNRLAWLEHRLAAIDKLKRRFGKTGEELRAKKKELERLIERLSHLEEEMRETQIAGEGKKKENLQIANHLSEKRRRAAQSFAPLVLAEAQGLNLPSAQFQVVIEPKPLSPNGTDSVRFLFSANLGHPPLPLEECASGGELSRLLLAIQIVLAEKENNHCLIFDEIDSNVGGQTAAILGETLRKLARKKQVICVTHFVQVAKAAHHHFVVTKKELENRTITKIFSIKDSERELEYNRMTGN